MKHSFRIITIAFILIAITSVSASGKGGKAHRNNVKSIELLLHKGLEEYDFNDTLVNDLSSYIYVEGSGDLAALVSNVASQVFLITTDSISKQGWPNEHYALQNSAYAIYNDQLYAYGGYGFWNSKNILRFWTSNEGWVPILVSEDSPALIPSFNSVLIIRDSIAYIIGGETTDFKNPFNRKKLNIIQKVDLKNKSVNIYDFEYYLSQDNLIIQNDSCLVFKLNNNLVYIDIDNFKISQTLINENLHLLLRELSVDDYLELIHNLNEPKKSLFLSNYVKIKWIFTPILIAIIFFVFKKINYKYINVLEIDGIYVKYGSKKFSLEDGELEIIHFLKVNGPCLAVKINSLFPPDLSLSHVNRLRSNIISNINRKVEIMTEGKIVSLICSRKATNDSRMTEYFLLDSVNISQ